jgi:hypothetical protein
MAYAVSAVGWLILHRLVVKTDLHNVPGLNSDSFLKGELPHCFFCDSQCIDLSEGDLSKVFTPDAWNFHKEIGLK